MSDMNNYVRGQFDVYCECVARGCKKVAKFLLVPPILTYNEQGEGIVDLPSKEVIEKIKKIALEGARGYKVKIYFLVGRNTVWINGKGIEYDELDAVIYRDEVYLEECLNILRCDREGEINQDEDHRSLGRLFGYGEREIEEFVKKEKQRRQDGEKGGSLLTHS